MEMRVSRRESFFLMLIIRLGPLCATSVRFGESNKTELQPEIPFGSIWKVRGHFKRKGNI
jgi:hypothetical protein